MSRISPDWNARRPLVIGFIALGLLTLGLGGWSALANIAGAVVSSGVVQVEGHRQVVQHAEGGVVGEIMVDDGDHVLAGAVLIRLDGARLQSELAIIEGQLFDYLAQRGRLLAERDGAAEITFDAEIATRAETRDLIDGQTRLFEARRLTRDRQIAQLNERKTQIDSQIAGIEAQITSLEEQIALIAQEQADQQSLLDRGLAQASRVLALQREAARLGGALGEMRAAIAQSRGRITETDIEILQLETGLREAAVTALQEIQYREIELRERRLAVLETLARLEVRAPVDGIVYGRQVHAVRAVVRGAEPLMYIVPQDTPLVISSRIGAINIDELSIGQQATLRFASFDQRRTPELFGHVTKISADVFTDEATGQPFYMIEIRPEAAELAKLGDLQLIPGMPVEAFILTGARTPLNYLLKPLADYFNRAFREG